MIIFFSFLLYTLFSHSHLLKHCAHKETRELDEWRWGMQRWKACLSDCILKEKYPPPPQCNIVTIVYHSTSLSTTPIVHAFRNKLKDSREKKWRWLSFNREWILHFTVKPKRKMKIDAILDSGTNHRFSSFIQIYSILLSFPCSKMKRSWIHHLNIVDEQFERDKWQWRVKGMQRAADYSVISNRGQVGTRAREREKSRSRKESRIEKHARFQYTADVNQSCFELV